MGPRPLSDVGARPLNFTVRRPMRSRLIAVVVWVWLSTLADAAPVTNDGSLDSIAWAATTASPAESCPLLLTAKVVDKAGAYTLRFTLKNVSGRLLTFYRNTLPWANVDSIQVAAVTTEGHLVLAGYPIEDDFGIDKVTVGPEETLNGDYDLSHRWNDKASPPNGFPRGTTIVLMWTYKVRAEEIPAKRWPVCSGVTAFKVPG